MKFLIALAHLFRLIGFVFAGAGVFAFIYLLAVWVAP